MIKSASQLKGKIKNLSDKDAKKAESYVRLFFMERFLERVSVSNYRHNFILKGGLLTSSLLGIDLRTTMDIDTTVTAIDLNENEIRRIVESICIVEMDDNISFEIISMETIMDDFEYPGVRVHLEGHFEGIKQPIKIDLLTDDVITPSAIEYDYRLRDYKNVDALIEDFNNRLDDIQNDSELNPWEKISAAIGYHKFDKNVDKTVDDVFKKADQAMYERKVAMKAERK